MVPNFEGRLANGYSREDEHVYLGLAKQYLCSKDEEYDESKTYPPWLYYVKLNGQNRVCSLLKVVNRARDGES